MANSRDQGRAAIIAGVRTPFAKRGTAYRTMTALDLATACVAELVAQTGLDPAQVEQVVYGQVIPSLGYSNIAREVVLAAGLPYTVEAYSVSRACATSYQSTVNAVQAIEHGALACAIAGGADSASDAPIAASPHLTEVLHEAERSDSMRGRLAAYSHLRPGDLVPEAPALRELSTGLTMGESAEKMAQENHISREAQDDYAHRSHRLAAAAWEQGKLADEVMTVYPGDGAAVVRDNLVRPDSDRQAYGSLRPVFDRAHGTITAGNSSPLTDGAAALLVMREDAAKSAGLEPLGYVRSYSFVAVDPREQLLIGPAYAVPAALERAGVELGDLALLDMHEAFAAQILSVTQALESDAFGREHLGLSGRVGDIDWDTFNVNGGSIAFGHPFAATGARQITQTLHELRRRGGGLALCSACAAGGLGAAMVLEVS